MNSSGQSQPTIGPALGRVPSGLYIITSVHQGRTAAMLASWVQQASFDPPAISIAIAKGRPLGQTILAARTLAVSIIPQDDVTLMKHFARGAPEPDPLAGCRLLEPAGPAPVLADALAWLQCSLLNNFDYAADHELFIARVNSGGVLRDGKAWFHQRKDGLRY